MQLAGFVHSTIDFKRPRIDCHLKRVASRVTLIGAELVEVQIGGNICKWRLLFMGIEAICPG